MISHMDTDYDNDIGFGIMMQIKSAPYCDNRDYSAHLLLFLATDHC